MKQGKKIKDLQDEIKRLRKLGRIERLPMKGAIGGTIQRLREAREMTLSDLAVKSKCGKPLINRLETHPNQNPTFRNLCKVAKGLSISLSQLIFEWETDIKLKP